MLAMIRRALLALGWLLMPAAALAQVGTAGVDLSATIGNTSAQCVPAVPYRKSMTLENVSATATIWYCISYSGACTAAANTAGSYAMPPGSGPFYWPPGAALPYAFSCIASAGSTPLSGYYTQ